jgi:hypothetical protein
MRSINETTASIDRWTPETVRIRPLLGDQTSMPAQDRARGDQAMPPQHLRQPPDERGEHRAIRPVQARLRGDPAQHGDLVTQHQELDVFGRRRTTEQQQEVQYPEEDQVEQTQRHGTRSCPVARALQSHSSEAQADFWNPAGPPKDHYDHRRTHGDQHVAAQRPLFNRMLAQLYHCLHTHQTYDPIKAFGQPTTTTKKAAT